MIQTNKIKLQLFNLPVLESLDDLSTQTKISKKSLYLLSTYNHYFYNTINLNKKSGGIRIVYNPSYKLKSIQSWILNEILNKLHVSSCCKGFEKKMSIYDNAIQHINSNYVWRLDLKDFFPSITSKRVYQIFRLLDYNTLISTILTNLCTVDNLLPQGSPCSPKLSNLISIRMDNQLEKITSAHGIIYTRYADDLSFSCNSLDSIKITMKKIKTIIRNNGFVINDKKTKFTGPSSRKKITGLIIYGNKIGIGRERYRLLRAEIFSLINDNDPKKIASIKGYLSFLKSVDKKRYELILKYISKLKIQFKYILEDLL